jgi:hypothetical protein
MAFLGNSNRSWVSLMRDGSNKIQEQRGEPPVRFRLGIGTLPKEKSAGFANPTASFLDF